MKTAFILATFATVFSVIEAAPSEHERDMSPANEEPRTPSKRETDIDVGMSEIRRAIDDIFNKRTTCQQYPCDDWDDCRRINCMGGCHPNFYGIDRCYA
ncbi:hypothetical protein Hte_004509 [Hypoxylon texense]